MRALTTVFTTMAVVIVYDVILRALFVTANHVTFFSILLGTLTSFFFWMFWADLRDQLPRWARWVLAAVVSGFLAALLAINFFAFWKLGDFINAYMLMFVSVDKGFVADQVRLYGLTWKSLGLLPIWLFLFWIWLPRKTRGMGARRVAPKKTETWFRLRPWLVTARIVLWAVLCLVFLNQVKYETVGQHKWADTSFLLAIKNYQKSTRLNVLRSSVRANVPALSGRHRPDVLLFLGESFGRQYLKLYGYPEDSTPQWTETFSGARAFLFRKALSNSSCTDVSLPSLFSGVGPEESDQKLHDLPLVWDWLKKAGYHTIFASPQKFAFANFDAFILSPGPDAYLSADQFMSLGSFITHNNGLDDIWAAKRTAEKMDEVPREEPLFLIFFTNATHYPFLQKSTELEVQPNFAKPYQNALDLTDRSLRILLEAFRKRGKADQLLVMSSADHGELEVHTRPVPRVASFYDEILSVPYAIRLPNEKGWIDERCERGLSENQNLLVQNLDLLPTLLDLLGFRESGPHAALYSQLKGHSLCQPVDAQRVLVGLNTNNIRHWDPEGFLLARGDERLVFTNSEGMGYYNLQSDPDQRQNLFSSMPDERIREFSAIIDGNLQLTRIRDLYFKEGLSALQKNQSEKAR